MHKYLVSLMHNLLVWQYKVIRDFQSVVQKFYVRFQPRFSFILAHYFTNQKEMVVGRLSIWLNSNGGIKIKAGGKNWYINNFNQLWSRHKVEDFSQNVRWFSSAVPTYSFKRLSKDKAIFQKGKNDPCLSHKGWSY